MSRHVNLTVICGPRDASMGPPEVGQGNLTPPFGSFGSTFPLEIDYPSKNLTIFMAAQRHPVPKLLQRSDDKIYMVGRYRNFTEGRL